MLETFPKQYRYPWEKEMRLPLSLSHVFPLASNVKIDMIFLGLHFVFLVRELLSGLSHINISSFQRLWKVLDLKNLQVDINCSDRPLQQTVQPQCSFVPLTALKMFHKEQLMHCKILAAIAMEISVRPLGLSGEKVHWGKNKTFLVYLGLSYFTNPLVIYKPSTAFSGKHLMQNTKLHFSVFYTACLYFWNVWCIHKSLIYLCVSVFGSAN